MMRHKGHGKLESKYKILMQGKENNYRSTLGM